MNEEERNSIEKVENLIKRCDECKLKECINCETNYTEITSIKRIVDSYKKILKENEELKSKLENKDKYFELITGLGYDYDGYYNRETSNGNIKDLADLMDELVQAAREGLNDMPYQK